MNYFISGGRNHENSCFPRRVWKDENGGNGEKQSKKARSFTIEFSEVAAAMSG